MNATEKTTRAARIGDTGIVNGMAYHGAGSGMASLKIEREDAVLLLHGDHRMIAHIASELDGREVEVIEIEGNFLPGVREVE